MNATRPRAGSLRRSLWPLALVLGLVSLTPGARAVDNVRAVEALSAEGDHLFVEGNFQQALVRYRRAQELIPDTRLLWNIARCHEELDELDVALALYRQVAATSEDPDWRWDAQRKIARLSRIGRASPGVAHRRPRRHVQQQLVIVSGPVAEDYSTAAKWTLVGGGLAAGALGGVFLALQDGAQSDLDSGALHPVDRQLREEDRDRYQRAMIASFSVGGALLASGIIWLIVDAASSDADTAGTVGSDPTSPWGVAVSPTASGLHLGISTTF